MVTIRTPLARGALAALALMALPSLAHATPASGLFYERTVMREADARCRLFAPEISAALAASSFQARGAALRAGTSAALLAAAADRAKTAAWSVPCTSPDIATAADRLKKAFAGYERLTFMDFPGQTATWRAERKPTAPVANHKAVDGPRWRLSETGRWDFGGPAQPITLGLSADPSSPIVATTAPGVDQAFTAFITVRDPAKSPDAYIDPRRPGAEPPVAITKGFVAKARQPAPASLLPGGQGQGVMFAFPPAAAEALAALDPREVVVVEFVYPGRPRQRATFEVGDFAAGRAFLMAGR